ncbi:hypothetical protein EJ04DRAFT_580008 [Polyplosphaeria fusca]|uniref:BRCT domain-containing protein n=1 Tax=Polyplosphaeria fusca TaxID=682080 RepID=A0A9P4UVR4_9PLEO|nr:hypothetical protein EJ04DRAFT_580008 [Polyplosphaeria fusca]
MASAESQSFSLLSDELYNDPSQLSQVLRQRLGSEHLNLFTVSTDDNPSVSHDTLSLQSPPLLPPPRPPTPRRAREAPANVNARPSKHCTASATTLVMEREGFEGAAADNPDDTQPDSQMYKNWTSGVFSNGVPEPRPARAADEDIGTTTSDPSDGVEDAGSSQQRNSPVITSPTVMLDDDLEAQNHAEPPPTSPLKFETPAMAGRKRDGEGQVLSSAMRTATTPGTTLTAAFGGGFGNTTLGHISLTQVFQTTQVGTSPIVTAPSEDAVFLRPSPNFANGRHSSPIPVVSSAAKVPWTDTRMRSSSEPRAEYVSMQQSQEARKRAHKEYAGFAAGAQQEHWDAFAEFETQLEKRPPQKRQREAGKLHEKLTTPLNSHSRRGRRRGLLFATFSSPISKVKRHERPNRSTQVVPANCDGAGDEDDSMDELSRHTPRKATVDPDDDSPDELSQPMPPSARPSRVTKLGRSDSSGNNVQVPNTSSHPRRPLSEQHTGNSPSDSPSSQHHTRSGVRVPASQQRLESPRLKSSKASTTITDSQPEADALSNIPRFKPLLPSSPSSNRYTVSQTTMMKKSGYTSQAVSSSMPLMPPESTPQVFAEENDEDQTSGDGVPSSPPAIRHEDDLYYDEHSGEEEAHEVEVNAYDSENVPQDANAEDQDREMQDVVDIGEISETEGQDQLISEEDDLVRSSHPEDGMSGSFLEHASTLRPQRQSTVPESDMIEDTQSSFFGTTPGKQVDEGHGAECEPNKSVDPYQMSGTEPFHTARESQSTSRANQDSGETPKRTSTATKPRVQSLSDIANEPDTQMSATAGDVDITSLGFAEELNRESDNIDSGSLTLVPARKKRRIVYGTKKKVSSPLRLKAAPTIVSLSPLKEVRAAREETPTPSTKAQREAEFTLAPALKKWTPQSPKTKPGRMGALKSVPKSLLRGKPTPPKAKAERQRSPMGRSPELGEAVQPDEVFNDAVMHDDDDDDELAGPAPQVDRGEAPSGDVIFPNRIFTIWPRGGFFPATCIGLVNSKFLNVRYDDGNSKQVESSNVRAFNLNVGDQVKVDEPGMKKHTYIVVGFKDKIDADLAGAFPETDQRGYQTVVLEVKQRESLPKNKTPVSKPVAVQMGSIYLTQQLWNKYRTLDYTSFSLNPSAVPSGTPSRVATPGMGPNAPSLREAGVRASSVAPSVLSGSVFNNMAFAVTFTLHTSDKDHIIHLITANGGQFVEEGFHELFHRFDDSKQDDSTPDELALRLEFTNLGFAGLITDAHSRRTKYIQALALNIPCIHHRWVTDSIAQSTPLSIEPYLLPAGLSTYLDPEGVLRSRVMKTYEPQSSRGVLQQIVAERKSLLENHSVLLVMGKSKRELRRQKPYLFLTHALGPEKVGQCADLKEAKQMAADGAFDWIYVDGGVAGVVEAAQALFGDVGLTKTGKTGAKNRKRKRDESPEVECLLRVGKVGEKEVRVACDEFVVQSLILGALIEE